MTDLETEFKHLVIDNWGLIRQLHERTENLRKQVIDTATAQLAQSAAAAAAGAQDIGTTGQSRWLRFDHGGKLISYIQMEFVGGTPRPTVKVWTGFGTVAGLSYVEVKTTIATLYAARGWTFDRNNQRPETIGTTITLDDHDVDAFVGRVAEAAIAQVEVAVRLREHIIARYLKPAAGQPTANATEKE